MGSPTDGQEKCMKHFEFDVLDWIQLMAEGADGAEAETGDNGQVAAGEEAAQEAYVERRIKAIADALGIEI